MALPEGLPEFTLGWGVCKWISQNLAHPDGDLRGSPFILTNEQVRFILHFYAIHALVIVMGWFRYGKSTLNFISSPVTSMGGSAKLFPSNFGYDLWVVYAVWIALLIILELRARPLRQVAQLVPLRSQLAQGLRLIAASLLVGHGSTARFFIIGIGHVSPPRQPCDYRAE